MTQSAYLRRCPIVNLASKKNITTTRNVDRVPNTLKVNGISYLLVTGKQYTLESVSLLATKTEMDSKDAEMQTSVLKLTICLFFFFFIYFFLSSKFMLN